MHTGITLGALKILLCGHITESTIQSCHKCCEPLSSKALVHLKFEEEMAVRLKRRGKLRKHGWDLVPNYTRGVSQRSYMYDSKVILRHYY